MIFLHPIYLLLAVPLGVSLLAWGFRSRWLLALRILTLLLIVLALAGIALRWPSRTISWRWWRLGARQPWS